MKITWDHIELEEIDGVITNSPLGPVRSNSVLSVHSLDAEIMNTDVPITPRHLITLDLTKGVEISTLLTPYKCLVCFAKMLPKATTKRIVEIRLTGKICHNIKELPEHIGRPQYSCGVMFPNGNFEGCNKDDDEYLEKKELYKKTAELVGGYYHES